MSKPEAGTKYTCESCGARFYDLNRTPVICLKCGTQQSPLQQRLYRTARRPVVQPVAALQPDSDPTAAEAVTDEVDDEAVEVDEEEAVEIEVDTDEEADLG